MATTKTIQPTGETITIPAMADQPDMSVVATDLGNITDAVNAQNQALLTLQSKVGLKAVDISSCSTLDAVSEALGTDDNVYGTASIGAQDSGNIKQIFPNPPGFANYTVLRVRKLSDTSMIATAVAHNQSISAVCYVLKGYSAWIRTEWQLGIDTTLISVDSGSGVQTTLNTSKSTGFLIVSVPTSATTANVALFLFVKQNNNAVLIPIKEQSSVSAVGSGSNIIVTTTTSYGATIRLIELM